MCPSVRFPVLCLLSACESGAAIEVVIDTASPGLGRTTWSGPAIDVGFGSRLATDGDRVYAGSPFGARVDELAVSGALTAAGTGVTGSFFGAGVAVIDGQLWVGAPGAGELWGDGKLVASEAGLGGVVIAGPSGWVATTASGWVATDGARLELGRRPDALLYADGLGVISGAALGEHPFWNAEGEAAPRFEANDEMGFALAECLAADGAVRDYFGAPGRGEIFGFITDPSYFGPGTARFGAAMACGTEPGVLWVGAPAAEDHAGAVYRVDGDMTITQVLSGNPLDELGAALVVAGGRVYVGAPGPASGAGYVIAVPEAELSP